MPLVRSRFGQSATLAGYPIAGVGSYVPNGDVAAVTAAGLAINVPVVVDPDPEPASGVNLDWGVWRTRLASTTWTRADFLVFGDSVTEGGSVTQRKRRWPDQVRDKVRGRLGLKGGEGWVNAHSLLDAYWSSGWTQGGSVGDSASAGLGHRSKIVGQDGWIQRTFVGTSIAVAFLRTPGYAAGCKVLVDGVEVGTFSTDSGSGWNGGGRYVHTFASPGSHVIRIVGNSANPVFLNGVFSYDGDETTGFHVIESAQTGSRTFQWTEAGEPLMPTISGELTAIQPALVGFFLGINDHALNESPVAYRTNLATLIAQVDAATTVDPDLLFIAPYQTALSGKYEQELYRDKLEGLADSYGGRARVLRLDYELTPSLVTSQALLVDGVHPGDRGMSLLAEAVTETLLSS